MDSPAPVWSSARRTTSPQNKSPTRIRLTPGPTSTVWVARCITCSPADRRSARVWDYDTIRNQIGLADQPEGVRLEIPRGGTIVMRREGGVDGKPVFTIARLPKAETDIELADSPGAGAIDRFLSRFDEK